MIPISRLVGGWRSGEGGGQKAEGRRQKVAFHSKAGRELNRFDMIEWVCEPTIRSRG